MKKNIFKLIAVAVVCITAMSVTSCCENDDPKPSSVCITNEEAGTFIVTNLTTNVVLDKEENFVMEGDSISIQFVPNDEYKGLSFKEEITFEGEKKGYIFECFKKTDALVVSPSKDRTEYKLSMKAIYDYDGGDTIYKYTATQELIIRKPERYSLIRCSLNIYPDLLLFVSPEFSYTDEVKVVHVISITDNMIEAQDSTLLGTKKYVSASTWSKEIYFFKWNQDYEITLKYVRKESPTEMKDTYDFAQSFYVFPLRSVGYGDSGNYIYNIDNNSSWHLDIDFTTGKETEDGLIRKEDVEEYLETLLSHPQSFKIHIDGEGKCVKE